jgi:hypothetical protein
MTGIDPKEAASALSDIDSIVHRVRRSQTYQVGSLMLILWGVLVFAGMLFFAFGILWSIALGHFTPRQLGVFWPTYFMMIYTIVGLWVGAAFVAIGLGITTLTMIGYFFSGDVFDLWMAVVNGGGLILGGVWMRRS